MSAVPDDPASVVAALVGANEQWAETFDDGATPAAPRLRLAVVTCMDARIDPAQALGLASGDAHVIRNAGGVVTDDVLRSLAVSHHLLGAQVAVVIGHTDCGMAKFTDEEIRARVETATGAAADLPFHAFGDVGDAVRASVARIESSPLLPSSYAAAGFVYDVATGRLQPVDG